MILISSINLTFIDFGLKFCTNILNEALCDIKKRVSDYVHSFKFIPMTDKAKDIRRD